MPHQPYRNLSPLRTTLQVVALVLLLLGTLPAVSAQKKGRAKSGPKPVSELAKLRDDYINATKEYKTSLEKLLALYETLWRRTNGQKRDRCQ
jgi:hypothetical protein